MISIINVKKWKLNDLNKTLCLFLNRLSQATAGINIDSNPLELTVLHIVKKTFISMQEIILLCKNGFADGALSLSRNIYEQFVLICFFRLHRNDKNLKDIIEDYNLNSDYQRWKLRYAEYNSLKDTPVKEKERKLLEQEGKEIFNKAHNNPHKIDSGKISPYWWSREKGGMTGIINTIIGTFSDDPINKNLIDAVSILRPYYDFASNILHANSLGNITRIGYSDGDNIINVMPTESGQSIPLYFSTMSMIGILGYVNEVFKLECTASIAELNHLAKYYLAQIEPL